MKKITSILIILIFIFSFSFKTKALEVNNTDISLAVGETYQIEILDESNYQSISYKSSLDSVCTVSNSGLITAINAGSTVIYIRADNDTLTINVSVYIKDYDIYLAEDEISLNIGETYQILAYTDGSYNLSFLSEDESICLVSSTGLITALSSGSTNILLSSGDITKTIKVIVSKEVEDIILDTYSYDLKVGDIANINILSDVGENSVTYTSNNTDVCIVTSSGQIRAIASGSAVVFISVGDKTVYITVSISEVIEITGFNITNKNVEIKVGETYQIEYIVIPSDADITITYKDYDSSVISVSSSGLITGLKEGSTTITVEAGTFTQEVEVSVSSSGFNYYWLIGIGVVILIVGASVVIIIVLKKRK